MDMKYWFKSKWFESVRRKIPQNDAKDMKPAQYRRLVARENSKLFGCDYKKNIWLWNAVID